VLPYSKKNCGLHTILRFKDDAPEFIDKMRDMLSILKENGFQERTIVIEQPRVILYEEEFQIVSKTYCIKYEELRTTTYITHIRAHRPFGYLEGNQNDLC
jgi:hypothetical protein